MIVIVDYGMGNLRSVRSAFELFSSQVKVSDNPSDLRNASKIVIPGVGAFGKAVENLRAKGLFDEIVFQKERGKPIFGICLGFQLLFESSDESPGVEGFGFLKGQVRDLRSIGMSPVPNMGWVLTYLEKSPIFEGLGEKQFFYYAHSFFAEPEEGEVSIAHFEFDGRKICTGVQKGSVFGVQFHPEKSGKVGLKVVENFVRL